MSRTTWSELLEDPGTGSHAADLRTGPHQPGHAHEDTIWDGVVPEPMLPLQLQLQLELAALVAPDRL